MAAAFSEYLGATPVIRLIQLARYSQKNALDTTLLAGVMFDGATGSCADHTAEGILRFAAAAGALAKGMPVVEAGYGSFSLALALACRRLGHPLTLVMPIWLRRCSGSMTILKTSAAIRRTSRCSVSPAAV